MRFDEQLLEIRALLEDGVPLADLKPSLQQRAAKCLQIRKRRDGMAIDFKPEACEKARKYHGYVVFISNRKMKPFDALSTYHQRNTLELFFEVLKQQSDGNRPRVWTPDRLRGRLLVQFVALCYYEFLAAGLRSAKAELECPLQIALLQRRSTILSSSCFHGSTITASR